MAYKAHKNNIDENQAAEEERNTANNADNIRNAAKVVEHIPGLPGVIGKGVDIADKVTGGKSSEALGAALSKTTQNMPNGAAVQKGLNGLNESGLGNAAGKAAGLKGLGKDSITDTVGEGENNSADAVKQIKDMPKAASTSDVEAENNNSDIVFFGKNKKLRKLVIVPIVSIILLPILIAVIKIAPMMAAVNYIQDKWNDLTDYISSSINHGREQKYYDTLKKYQDKYNRKGICIDVNLITSAMTIETDFDSMLTDNDIDEEDIAINEDPEIFDEEDNDEEEDNNPDYKKMKKYVKYLAKYQMVHNIYNLDEAYKAETGSYCKATETIVEDTEKNEANDNKTKKYYLYYPAFDENGNCSNKTKKKDVSLDIGTPGNREDTAFYWYLENKFVKTYYKKQLPSDEKEKQEKIKKIIEEIYSLYDTVGPSTICTSSGSSYSCNYAINDQTTTKIKIRLLDNDFNDLGEDLLDVEDYIAGVVYGENGYISTDHNESMKAQAVAARSYLLKRTQGLLKNYIEVKEDGTTILGIRNSNSDQVYCNPYTGCYIENNVYHSADASHPATKAALNEGTLEILKSAISVVTGQVLVDANGNIIQTGYSSTTQTEWNTASEAGTDYRTMLMETYPTAVDISANCLLGGTGYGAATVSGTFTGVATECNSFFSYSDPFYWGDPVNSPFTYGTYNPFQSYGIQCTWYAYGRALKALVENGNLTLSEAKAKLFFSSNAGEWWQENLNKEESKRFQYSSNLEDVREGSIVVWVGGHPGNVWCSSINDYCGHVAFVERVVRNPDGTVKEVSISQANPDKCRWTTYTSLEAFNRNGATTGNRHIAGFIYLFNR